MCILRLFPTSSLISMVSMVSMLNVSKVEATHIPLKLIKIERKHIFSYVKRG
ncbi:exported hypothetical protein [Alteromonas infernus]